MGGLASAYLTLCKFYNAAGFADVILRATWALTDNSTLNQHQLYIVGEYQDFNAAEEQLLEQITQDAGARSRLAMTIRCYTTR